MKEIIENIVVFTVLAVLVILIIIIAIFSIPPVKYAFDNWSDYWNKPSIVIQDLDMDMDTYIGRSYKAQDDCKNRAVNYYKSSNISAYSSSTSESYDTYDCYGIKFNLIK